MPEHIHNAVIGVINKTGAFYGLPDNNANTTNTASGVFSLGAKTTPSGNSGVYNSANGPKQTVNFNSSYNPTVTVNKKAVMPATTIRNRI